MTPPADDTSTLLARPTGRDASIESLVALHDSDARSALRRVLGRSQEEDDLVQEVFTRLVVRLRQPGDLCVGAWVRGVAHNLAVDEIRRRRPVPVEDICLDRPVASAAEEVVAGSDLYSCLVEGAGGLPERQRAALAAALSSDGITTVASRLGVSVHAAESLLSRARGGLRSHLAMAGSDDNGSVRVSLGAALAAMALVVAGVVRRWRTAGVAIAAIVATGAVAGVSLIPAIVGSAPPAMSPPAAAAAGSDRVTVDEVATEAGTEAGAGVTQAPAAAEAGAGVAQAPAAADAHPASGPTPVAAAPPANATTAVPGVPALPALGAVADPTILPVVGLAPLAGDCRPVVGSVESPRSTSELTGALTTAATGLTNADLPATNLCGP